MLNIVYEDNHVIVVVKPPNMLSQADKTILLLYVDCQSYRKVGKKLNLSHMTIRREILRIRDIVLEEFNK